MIFIIRKEHLVENLQKIIGPSATRQSSPILNSVLITTLENTVEFTTTDLDMSITVSQETSIEETGQAAIPMKRFLSIARELPSGEVKIEKNKNNLLISCGKIEFKINSLNPEEFPKIKKSKGVSLIRNDPKDLEEMIQLTSFCVGREDTNYVLGGLLFEIEGNKITLVATDGKRLAFIQRKLPSTQPEITTKISFILPLKAVLELYRLVKGREEDVYLFIEGNKIGIDLKNTQFMASPMEGEFPNYSQYIPQESKNKLVINREKILFALKRASLLATPDYQGVKIELRRNTLTIYKSTPQLGEVKEVVESQYSGGNLEVGFNPGYLIDVLKNLDDEEVCIEFSGADKPAVLKKEGYVYLVLPLKI
ncbi:MAG: DNA polymerase III subunit beta [Omnitrophica bacterium]|nr:DNA polymerase III subunit beta [Candidatus Omnitrophota bacterium]